MTKGTPNPPMTAEIKLDVFWEIAKARGWKNNADIARAIGLSTEQVRRIMSGKQEPTMRFACGFLHYSKFAGFRRTFEIVPADTTEEGATP